MATDLKKRIVDFLEAICAGENKRATVAYDELECAAFVEGYDDDRCLNLCREAVANPASRPLVVVNALDQCALPATERLRLLVLGLANDTLDVSSAVRRLAGYFPGHDLTDSDRFVIELAYQLEHDRNDNLSSSFDELVLAVKQRSVT